MKAYDPVSLVSAGALLALIAATASFVPARRASRLNPRGLRYASRMWLTAILYGGIRTTCRKETLYVRVGVFTALLAQLPLDDVLKKLKSINVDTVELGTGNYPGDPLLPQSCPCWIAKPS